MRNNIVSFVEMKLMGVDGGLLPIPSKPEILLTYLLLEFELACQASRETESELIEKNSRLHTWS